MRLGNRLQHLAGIPATLPTPVAPAPALRLPVQRTPGLAPLPFPSSAQETSDGQEPQHTSPLHQELSRYIPEAYAQLSAKLPPVAFELVPTIRKIAPIVGPFLRRFGVTMEMLQQIPNIDELPALAQTLLASVDEPKLRGYLTLLRDQVGSLLERTAPTTQPETAEIEPQVGDGDAGEHTGQHDNDDDEPGDTGSDASA